MDALGWMNEVVDRANIKIFRKDNASAFLVKKLAVAVKIDDRVEQNGQVGSEVVLP